VVARLETEPGKYVAETVGTCVELPKVSVSPLPDMMMAGRSGAVSAIFPGNMM